MRRMATRSKPRRAAGMAACGALALVCALLAASRGLAQAEKPSTGADETPGRGPDAPRVTTGDLDPQQARPWSGGIVGSKHDFTDGGRLPGDLCTPCHTPHITARQAPLLSERVPGGTRLRPYQTPAGQLDAASLVCLTCHDGIIAPDVYAGPHAMRWSDRTGRVSPGSARLTSHPVGVLYPASDPSYHSPAAVTADGRIRLPGGRVQCTSCHDPHNTQGHPGMLVRSNERSRLCLSCHRL